MDDTKAEETGSPLSETGKFKKGDKVWNGRLKTRG